MSNGTLSDGRLEFSALLSFMLTDSRIAHRQCPRSLERTRKNLPLYISQIPRPGQRLSEYTVCLYDIRNLSSPPVGSATLLPSAVTTPATLPGLDQETLST